MGQQQLLLVILVTIIVGVATVVALNVFGSSAKNANTDAVRQDVLQIASSAQGWYIKPAMLNGGGKSFKNITFNDINFPANEISSTGLKAINNNGTYVISNPTATQFTITAYPSSDPNYNGVLPTTTKGVSNNDATFASSGNTMTATIYKSNITWTTSSSSSGSGSGSNGAG